MSQRMAKPTKWHVRPGKIDQSGYPSRLIRVFCCVLNSQLRTQTFFMRTAKTLIRLDGCPGWSESSQGAHAILLVLLGTGSNHVLAAQQITCWPFQKRFFFCSSSFLIIGLFGFSIKWCSVLSLHAIKPIPGSLTSAVFRDFGLFPVLPFLFLN